MPLGWQGIRGDFTWGIMADVLSFLPAPPLPSHPPSLTSQAQSVPPLGGSCPNQTVHLAVGCRVGIPGICRVLPTNHPVMTHRSLLSMRPSPQNYRSSFVFCLNPLSGHEAPVSLRSSSCVFAPSPPPGISLQTSQWSIFLAWGLTPAVLFP